MEVCMYGGMHACREGGMDGRMEVYVSIPYVCMCVCAYVCVCVYVCMRVCMHACMDVWICMDGGITGWLAGWVGRDVWIDATHVNQL